MVLHWVRRHASVVNLLTLARHVDPAGLVLSAYLGTEDAALQTSLGLVYPLYLTGGLSVCV